MARSINKSRFAGFQSRLRTQAKNTLGIIMTSDMMRNQKFRDKELEKLDAYYEGRQYDDLMDWDEACSQEEYVPIHKRKPRVHYRLAKALVDKVGSKLTGTAVFPKFTIEEDPDDTAFFRVVQKACDFRANLRQPIRQCLTSGSVFVRFQLIEGAPQIEHFNSKYCYPTFDATGELQELEVKYVFEDPSDKDQNGNPKMKWYRLSLSKTVDILYDTPEYREGVSDPKFTVVAQNNHNLGWVQGEWLRTDKHKFTPDGDGIFACILDFLDELNYSLSQSAQAVSYNQEPQLTVNGVDEDELDTLIKSSQKAWNLGKEGKAEFVGSDLKGVEAAETNRDHMRTLMLDVVRIVLHDPEKMVAAAQSGRALEILNAPLVELIDELRTALETGLRNLLIKIGMTMLAVGAQGADTVLEVPAGYQPKSLDISVQWPPIFPLTIQDVQMKVQSAVQAATGKLLSRESLTRWLAGDFGIENIDEELQKIEAEPDLNPFGSFGGGGFGGAK